MVVAAAAVTAATDGASLPSNRLSCVRCLRCCRAAAAADCRRLWPTGGRSPPRLGGAAAAVATVSGQQAAARALACLHARARLKRRWLRGVVGRRRAAATRKGRRSSSLLLRSRVLERSASSRLMAVAAYERMAARARARARRSISECGESARIKTRAKKCFSSSSSGAQFLMR